MGTASSDCLSQQILVFDLSLFNPSGCTQKNEEPSSAPHWAVENSPHWCLDVIMNEDNARNRLDNGPHNLAILRHMALNLIRKEPSKGSLRVKIKRAGWKDEYLAKVLAQI